MVSSAAELRNLYVLVCEKDDVYFDKIREAALITDLFKGCIRATTGSEALQKLNNQKFGLIIIDMDAEKADAIAVVKHLKSTSAGNDTENQDTTIMVSFLSEDPFKKQELEKLGITSLFGKPFVTENLIENIIKAVGLA